MRSSTYSLAAVATVLVIASPQVNAALNSTSLTKLGLGGGSKIIQAQGKGDQSSKGWGGGYGVPEGGSQKGGGYGGEQKGGAGGGSMGDKQGGGGGGTWEGKKGGAGGGTMGEKGGGGGGGTWEGKKGGGGGGTWEGKKGGGGGGGGTWEGKKGGGGGGTWEGKRGDRGEYRGGRGGGVWMGERDGRRGPNIRIYPGRGYGPGCGWLRERALDTGSRYWWRRYRDCRGS